MLEVLSDSRPRFQSRALTTVDAEMAKKGVAFKYNTDKTNYTVDEDSDILAREAYVQMGNVIDADPKIKFWIGQRFYDRHDMYITDYFALDMSGYGGGVEDINFFGHGSLAISVEGCSMV